MAKSKKWVRNQTPQKLWIWLIVHALISFIVCCLISAETSVHINDLMQERRNSSALAMELRLPCTNPSICFLCQNVFYSQIWVLVQEQNDISRGSHFCCIHIIWYDELHYFFLLKLNSIAYNYPKTYGLILSGKLFFRSNTGGCTVAWGFNKIKGQGNKLPISWPWWCR